MCVRVRALLFVTSCTPLCLSCFVGSWQLTWCCRQRESIGADRRGKGANWVRLDATPWVLVQWIFYISKLSYTQGRNNVRMCCDRILRELDTCGHFHYKKNKKLFKHFKKCISLHFNAMNYMKTLILLIRNLISSQINAVLFHIYTKRKKTYICRNMDTGNFLQSVCFTDIFFNPKTHAMYNLKNGRFLRKTKLH